MSLLDSLPNSVRAAIDFIPTQFQGKLTDLRAGEVVVGPTSTRGHYATGPDDTYVLTDHEDFQLFRTPQRVLTFIHGDDNTASFWGGGERTIYDFGRNNIFRFSELEASKVDVFGFNSTDRIVIFNTKLQTIQPDGHDGTLIGNIDFHKATVLPSQVQFLDVNAKLSISPVLVPLTT